MTLHDAIVLAGHATESVSRVERVGGVVVDLSATQEVAKREESGGVEVLLLLNHVCGGQVVESLHDLLGWVTDRFDLSGDQSGGFVFLDLLLLNPLSDGCERGWRTGFGNGITVSLPCGIMYCGL